MSWTTEREARSGRLRVGRLPLLCCKYCNKIKMSTNFDITHLMAPYLDVHMINPMLDFLRDVSALLLKS